MLSPASILYNEAEVFVVVFVGSVVNVTTLLARGREDSDEADNALIALRPKFLGATATVDLMEVPTVLALAMLKFSLP